MRIRNKAGRLLFLSSDAELEIDDCDLREAALHGFNFAGTMITGTLLCGADLSEADFYWCVLIGVDLTKVNLKQARFKGCDLVRCSFRFTDLRGADFGPSYLGDLSAISKCDFTGSDLSNAVFESALYDEETIFPQGFDPGQHGMIPIREWDLESRVRRRPAHGDLNNGSID